MGKSKLPRGIRAVVRGGKAVWLIQRMQPDGSRHQVTCHSEAEALEVFRNQQHEKCTMQRQVKLGLITKDEVARVKSKSITLQQHLDAFKDDLATRNIGKQHICLTYNRCLAILRQGRIDTIDKMAPATVRAALLAIKEAGRNMYVVQHGSRYDRRKGGKVRVPLTDKSMVHYTTAIKEFSVWLCDVAKAVQGDPLHSLKATMFHPEATIRYARRVLTSEEFETLCEATEHHILANDWKVRMKGPERAILYRLANGTGFRVLELGSLTPESFHLNADPPTITLKAGKAKDKKASTVEQPIRRDLAKRLRPWLATKTPGVPVFHIDHNECDRLKLDLEYAGVEYGINGERADFHALRHTYITRIATNKDIPIRVAQELARHKTIGLTVKYSKHIETKQKANALECLSA